MEWDTALKWLGIGLVAAGVSTAVVLLINWKLTGPAATAVARAEARAELDRILVAAAEKAKAKTAAAAAPAVPPPVYPQSEASALVYHV